MSQIITERDFQRGQQDTPKQHIVKFTNFTSQEFTYSWNGVPWKFAPKEFKFMESGLAAHFAKHLVNRELLARGRDNDTSPKKQSDNVAFMELYRRAYEEVDMGEETDPDKMNSEVIDRNMKAQLGIKPTKTSKPTNTKKPEKEFEELDGDDDDQDAPPDSPSNMSAKADGKASTKK